MTKYQQIAKRISSASQVLDVGCGAGDLGRSLLGKQCSLIGLGIVWIHIRCWQNEMLKKRGWVAKK